MGAQNRERAWAHLDDSWSLASACAGTPERDRRGRIPADGAYEADTARSIWFCEDRNDAVSRMLTFEAKRICADECPVQAECLSYAIEGGIQHGVWGGLTPKERTQVARQRPIAV